MTTLSQNQKESYNKMIEINSIYNSFDNLENRDYRGWIKKLDALKPELCDSIYWSVLMENIESIKSKIS